MSLNSRIGRLRAANGFRISTSASRSLPAITAKYDFFVSNGGVVTLLLQGDVTIVEKVTA